MKKNYFLLMAAMACFAGKSSAQVIQPCGTDEVTKRYQLEYPKIAEFEKQLEEHTANYIKAQSNPYNYAKRTTATHADTDWYDIPLVVHVMHNHGAELLPDDKIYQLIAEMNKFYSLNSDTTAVIKPFKKYVGKAKIRFHLATRDPNGNPTTGITHRATYLTYGMDDQAKMDQWPPSSYVNIWFENVIGQKITNGVIVAYATPPSSAAANPYRDGIISNYSFINDATTTGGGGSIDHEMGHILNLKHTFGSTNDPHTNKSGSCNDDDGVDDTPPTEGNLGGCHLYDSVCATNYFKLYTNAIGGDSLANYPDTSNEQNIMNYADCKLMFTKGQITRMRAALNSDIGDRSNLWDSLNLVYTGALAPRIDMKPNPEFAAMPLSGITNQANYMDMVNYFVFPNVSVRFKNESWNDTITNIIWSFDHGAAVPTTPTGLNVAVVNSFSQTGWVNITMKVTGNNSGDTTATFNNVYVANPVATSGANYLQDFKESDLTEWPSFNYYNNGFKWAASNTVGYYDNTSMKYVGFDSRSYSFLAPPKGDFDDFFTCPFDLTGYADPNLYLNFFYTAAGRTSLSTGLNDELDIDYSTDGKTWTNIAKMTKRDLENRGSIATEYVPTSLSDWAPKGYLLPSGARTAYTVFRFRYKPGIGADGFYSSGNNFYMDKLSFGAWPAAINGVNMGASGIAIAPNPTQGDAYVIVKDASSVSAKVVVTDITGKTVYTTTQQLSGNEAHILIPHSALQTAGMYMVQTITGGQVNTQKLVVY